MENLEYIKYKPPMKSIKYVAKIFEKILSYYLYYFISYYLVNCSFQTKYKNKNKYTYIYIYLVYLTYT